MAWRKEIWTVVIVTVVTVLIWFWAAGETQEQRAVNYARVEFVVAEPEEWLLANNGQALTLYWQAGAPMPTDSIVFVHLFDMQGNFVAGNDSRPRSGLYSTLAWQPSEGIVDEHPWPDVPAGDYMIKIGLYDAVTQNRLAVTAANGETLPDGVLPIGKVTLP